MKFFKKDDLTSWQVHEPNNNQGNIHFRDHFFLYVDNPQLLTIILKKFCRSSTPRFIWNFLFVLNKLIQSHFTFFFLQFQFNNIKKSMFCSLYNFCFHGIIFVEYVKANLSRKMIGQK